MSKISFTHKKHLNPLMTVTRDIFVKSNYFYIVSRQEETRFTRLKKTSKTNSPSI